MLLLYIVEVLVIVLTVVFCATQIIIPLLTNRPLLWWFRGTPWATGERLQETIEEARQEIDNDRLCGTIEEALMAREQALIKREEDLKRRKKEFADLKRKRKVAK